jgi:hypothetical protein
MPATKRSSEEVDALVKQFMRHESDAAIALFKHLLNQGFDGFCASVAATGDVPGTGNTDRALMQGRMNQEEMAHPVWRMRAKEIEKKHPGLTNGRTYFPSLARKGVPNDPGAWCGSYGEMIEQAKRTGKGIEGVIREVEPAAPPTSPALSENAIRSHLRREIMDDPSLYGDKKRIKKLREDIVSRHTPKWRKKLLKG